MSATHEAHEPFDGILSVHAAWDVGGGGACFERIPSNGALVSFITPVKTLTSSPPRETTFCEGCHNTPTQTLGAARARRRRQATVPAAGRCNEHAPRDLARRPANCSQKAPRLGSERKSSGSENKKIHDIPMTHGHVVVFGVSPPLPVSTSDRCKLFGAGFCGKIPEIPAKKIAK